MANTRTDVLAVARSQVGTKESPPQSNNVLYARWFGMSGSPWCAMYLSWVLDQVGNRSGYRFASTAASVAWARRAGRLRPVADARPGDIVVRLYTATTGHTGMVAANEGPTTVTLEGNTSPANSRDGGEVMERRRSSSWWQFCIGIDYDGATTPAPAPPPPATTPQPRRLVYGADISHHQGDLTVATLKASGVEFLWHKATEGGDIVDGQYRVKRAQAQAAGVPFGAYDFVRPNVDPVQHARHFRAEAGQHGPGMLRPAMDLEVPGIGAAWLRTYRNEVERLFGCTPVAYVATAIYQQPGIPQALAGCPLWVPRYNTQPPVIPWQVWQHTDKRPCPGTAGIDGNLTYDLSSVLLGATTPPHEEDDMTPEQAAQLAEVAATTRKIAKRQVQLVRDADGAAYGNPVYLVVLGGAGRVWVQDGSWAASLTREYGLEAPNDWGRAGIARIPLLGPEAPGAPPAVK